MEKAKKQTIKPVKLATQDSVKSGKDQSFSREESKKPGQKHTASKSPEPTKTNTKNVKASVEIKNDKGKKKESKSKSATRKEKSKSGKEKAPEKSTFTYFNIIYCRNWKEAVRRRSQGSQG